MPRLKMTDAAVRRISPPASGQVDYWDEQVSGLALRVFASGARSWLVRPRVLRGGEWKQAWIGIGRFPDLPIGEARDRAMDVILRAKRGEDPGAQKSRDRSALVEESRNSFGHLADEFLAKHVSGLKRNTARQYQWALKGFRSEKDGEGVKAWASRPVTQITKRDVLELIEGMVDRGSPIQANRQLAYLKRFFAWCAERDIIETIPTDRIRPPVKNNHRDRALTNGEIVEVYRAIVEDPGRKQGGLFRALLAILLLTGQRREEVAGMRWSEIKGLESESPLWEIPGERTKNHRPHIIPLAPQVVAFLGALPRIHGSDLVFTTTGETSVSGFSRAKLRADEAIAESRKKAGVREGIPAWTLHDLRRTVSTRMHEDLGIQPHIVEAILNHVSGSRAGVAGVYNRALYLDDKRRALEAWANHVDALVSGAAAAEADNVVRLKVAGRSTPRT